MAAKITFECRAQGVIKQSLTAEELGEWLKDEIMFWRGIDGINTDLILGRQNYGNLQISLSYRNEIEAIQGQLLAGNTEPFQVFLRNAENLSVILGHGLIAANMKALAAAGGAASAQWVALIFSESILNVREEVRREIAGFAAAIRFNPRILTTSDTISAQRALENAETAAAQAGAKAAELNEFFATKQKELADLLDSSRQELLELHNQYETYLVLQGPSRHWKNVATRATKIAISAFVVFVVLLLVPALTIWRHWDSVVAFLDHVIEESRGTFSIASLVMFTIPFFAYAWVLKHVSRVFNQNLLTGADAEHRRVMAVTFLGLARRKSVGIGEEDRTLVLNALFRPSPLTPQDDGPPVGLIELMSKKT